MIIISSMGEHFGSLLIVPETSLAAGVVKVWSNKVIYCRGKWSPYYAVSKTSSRYQM